MKGMYSAAEEASDSVAPVSWVRYRIPIILSLISLLLVAAAFVLIIKQYQSKSPIRFSSDAGKEPKASESSRLANVIAIDIEGAVKKPGIYQLPLGSRVEDAIAAAGGLSQDADEERIARTLNRAAKLSDGAKLYIPKKGDNRETLGILGGKSSDVLKSHNINTASQSELEALPGIGPVTAQKIIANRPYQTLEELVSKKALGQSLFEKLKDQLTL